MDDFSEDALGDTLKGLYAYDTEGSVVWIEDLRARVEAQLSAMTWWDRETFFAKRLGDKWSTEEARAVLFNLKDTGDFLRWLAEHMNCHL